jgi:mannose-1-phosphate guanylyltransferase
MKAVIQAGGKGTRLAPYTLVLPKPMMPVGDQPVIEILLKWLRRNSVEEVVITTGYLAHLLKAFCQDGKQWDLTINYCQEPEPLGTVGSLQLIREHLDEPFLMLNGDLITDLDLMAFKKSHLQSGALLSIATKIKSVDIDLGVLDTVDNRVVAFREKPTLPMEVSMGLYIIDPEVLKYIPKGVPFGFDNLIHVLLEKNIPVNTYQHTGKWMDIGRVEDFTKAQEEWAEHHEKSMLGV